jgi:hypothetical protein
MKWNYKKAIKFIALCDDSFINRPSSECYLSHVTLSVLTLSEASGVSLEKITTDIYNYRLGESRLENQNEVYI